MAVYCLGICKVPTIDGHEAVLTTIWYLKASTTSYAFGFLREKILVTSAGKDFKCLKPWGQIVCFSSSGTLLVK